MTKVKKHTEQCKCKSQKNLFGRSEGLSLDTIAQLGTDTQKAPLSAIQKRARSKFLSLKLVSALHKLDSPLKSSYGRSLSCCNHINVEGGVAKSEYCKNRWCLVCARIKTAVLIEKYKGSLDEEITDPYFVTLTIPNCQAESLEGKIKEMWETLKRTIEKRKKQHQRGNASKLKCVVKLECTYNSQRHDFHPHFHIIVNTKKAAEYLQSEWLTRFPSTREAAQDIRKADENSKIELFKYTTKLMSQIEKFEEGEDNIGKIYIEALDVIYRAISRKRTLRAYGFRLKIDESFADEDLQAITEVEASDGDYDYSKEHYDWINSETGEFLAAWIITKREIAFQKSIISKTGRKFLKKYLTITDIIDLVEGYRFETRFRSKLAYVKYIIYHPHERMQCEDDLYQKAKSMNFDDSREQFLEKFYSYLDKH